MRTQSISSISFLLLFSLALIYSCSDTVDPPKDNDITIMLNPTDAESEEQLENATHWDADTDDAIGAGEDAVTREKGTEITIRTELDDYESTETSVTFNRDKTVDIPMTAVDTTDPVDTDSVEVTVWADDADTGDELDDLTFRTDGEIISAGVNRMILTEPQDTTIDLTIEQDGYESLTESILFDEDKEITVELEPKTPEVVTISYNVRDDADQSIDAAELTVADTLVAEGTEGSFTLPFSESDSVTVCGSAEWHEDGCSKLLPDQDQPIDLSLTREMVSVSVTPEIVGYTDLYANDTGITMPVLVVDNTMYYLSVGDSTRSGAGRANSPRTVIAEGVTTTIDYPAGPEPITIEFRAEYFPEEGHEHSDNDYLNVAEGETEVPGDTDSDITLDLEHVPACRDDVDNDFTSVKDEEAPGCIDYEASTSHEVGSDGWVYEPDDDVELLQAGSFGILFGGNSLISISSAEGSRKYGVGGAFFPAAIQFALGQIDFYLATKLEADQDGESFAVTFTCGDTRDTRTDTTGTTKLVFDDPEVDGWHTPLINGVDANFFSAGLSCMPWATHITKINGDPAGDGNDDVVFAVPDTSGSTTFVYIVEPEMVTKTHPSADVTVGKSADRNIEIRDVRTRSPREALRALDPRRRQ